MNDTDCLALQHSLTNALAHLCVPATARDRQTTITSVKAALSELAQDNPDYEVVIAGILVAYRDLKSATETDYLRGTLEAQAKMMFGIDL